MTEFEIFQIIHHQEKFEKSLEEFERWEENQRRVFLYLSGNPKNKTSSTKFAKIYITKGENGYVLSSSTNKILLLLKPSKDRKRSYWNDCYDTAMKTINLCKGKGPHRLNITYFDSGELFNYNGIDCPLYYVLFMGK